MVRAALRTERIEMDAIYGVTMQQLAELNSKYTELKTQFGEQQGEAAFGQYLASRGLNHETWANAHNGWMARWQSDPTGRAEAEYHMIVAQLSQKAHFGDVRDMSADTVEGITLDQYAQITVAVSRQGADADQIVRQFGLQDIAHWQRANAAWGAKMGADTTHALSMQYGQLYQKYAGPSFQQEMMQNTANTLAAHHQAQKDVVDEPEEELTAELCLQKMRSPSRNERWKYSYLYANMVDLGNVPDKAAAIQMLTPLLIEKLEQSDEHTTSDAEGAIRQLWDLGVRNNDDVKHALIVCLNRAISRLAMFEAAFAPIQNQAVPERVTLQQQIQDHKSLVETLDEYGKKDWEPEENAAPAAPAFGGAPMQAFGHAPQQQAGFGGMPNMNMPNMPSFAKKGGFPAWILAPVIILGVVGIGGAAFLRSRAASNAAANAAASASATIASAQASAAATATTPPAAATTAAPAAADHATAAPKAKTPAAPAKKKK